MTPRRGEVWWARLDPTLGSEIKKTRPCIILTNDVLNQRRRTVVVVPLTTSSQANPPLLVSVNCAGRSALAVIDQIRAVAKERLGEPMGRLSANHLAAVEEAVREILDLE